MADLIASVMLVAGGLFMLLAGLGVMRMPDLYMRLQAATKAATLGAGLMLTAVAVHFAETAVSARALLVVGFVLLTAPVAAHMVGKAAHAAGVPMWSGTRVDELRDAETETGGAR